MKASTVVYYEQKVTEIMDFIQHHYHEPLTLSVLAKTFALSPFHLSRMFKKITKQKISTYLNQVRVEKALSLITTTDKRIHDIAWETGFNDYETLSRNFKKQYKVAPEDLRTIISVIKNQTNLSTGFVIQCRHAMHEHLESIKECLPPGTGYVYKAERNKTASIKREKFIISELNEYL